MEDTDFLCGISARLDLLQKYPIETIQDAIEELTRFYNERIVVVVSLQEESPPYFSYEVSIDDIPKTERFSLWKCIEQHFPDVAFLEEEYDYEEEKENEDWSDETDASVGAVPVDQDSDDDDGTLCLAS